MKGRWAIGAAAAVTAVVFGASLVALADEVSPVANAWIDDPLDGTAYGAPEQITVVAHGTSPDGLTAMELIVDGAAVVGTAPGGNGLVLAEFQWTPPGAGAFVLTVRAVENATRYRDSDPVTIFVGGSPEDAALLATGTTAPPTTAVPTIPETAVPTATTSPSGATTVPPSPTTTGQPTRSTTTTVATTTSTAPPPTEPPPCSVAAPVLDYPIGGTSVADRTPTLSWVPGNDCEVDEYLVEVSDADGNPVASGSPSDTSWTVPSPLENCSVYTWRVRAKTARASGPWSATTSFLVDVGGC